MLYKGRFCLDKDRNIKIGREGRGAGLSKGEGEDGDSAKPVCRKVKGKVEIARSRFVER